MTLVVLTWAIESVVLRLAQGDRFGRKSLTDLFWINLLTNPAANYAYGELGWNWWLVESLVTVVEAWPIARSLRVSIGRGFVLSLLANGVTAAMGRGIEILTS
jgi:hypothetical protein